MKQVNAGIAGLSNMLGELIPCGGGDPIPLTKANLLVGRRSSCDISLQFPNVSSHHCEIELINGYWHVRDLASRNGIKVNGARCDGKWLMPGDTLSIAKHKYEVNYTPQGDAPLPEEEDPFALTLLEKAGLVPRQRRVEAEDDNLILPESQTKNRPARSTMADEESTISDMEVFDPASGNIPLEWLMDSDDEDFEAV